MNPLFPASANQTLIAFDLEGVLAPEIWIALAEATGHDVFRRTTRDEPDYSLLMQGRLEALRQHGITLSKIQSLVEALEPLPGAVKFLDEVRRRHQVVILSDTYEQLASPIFAKLGQPMVMCHRLEVVDDEIRGVDVRRHDAKRLAVSAFAELGYEVWAIGDSYNDLSMLRAAADSCLFRAPANVRSENTDLRATDTYEELLAWIVDR